MKLSIKFFCIAYIIVLLSTSLCGVMLINNSNKTFINAKIEQVNAVTKYSANSFISLNEVSLGQTTPSQVTNILEQIKNTFGNSILDIDILSPDNAEDDCLQLNAGQGFSRFKEIDHRSVLESVCRIDVNNRIYYVVVYSDLSDIEKHYKRLWILYGCVVFSFALISGLVLYFLSKKITNPIYNLSKAVSNLAEGNYGETICVNSKDIEIQELSHRFNAMSLTIKEKIGEIQNELSKRDRFVSNFSHEIKTPMTAIIGYSQMLNTYSLEEEEKKQAIESIYKESSRLEKLAMQLLDLYIYKNEEIKIEKFPLKDIGSQLTATLKFSEEKYNVRMMVDLHDCIVSANKDLLLSLLYNLADNALKASTPKSEVRIYSTASEGTIRICVKDTGKGVAQENLKYLTEPFYREDKARSRELGGAGLGLSLCQRIAEIHHTNLVFESEKNKGTTVSFELKSEVGNIDEN